MWPGETMSSMPLDASVATWMVRERSAAEMPVVTPSLASMETVKAVFMLSRLSAAIGGRPGGTGMRAAAITRRRLS